MKRWNLIGVVAYSLCLTLVVVSGAKVHWGPLRRQATEMWRQITSRLAYQFQPHVLGHIVLDTNLQGHQAVQSRVLSRYGTLPLNFEANQGQADPQVKFLSRGRGYSLSLTRTEAILALSKSSTSNEDRFHQSQRTQPALLRMRLVGANRRPKVAALDELPGTINYLIGNHPEKWRKSIRAYARVKYENVYPGVSLIYHGNQRQLEYDLLISPGVDPKIVRLEFKGLHHLERNREGDLLLHTQGGSIRLQRPSIFQEIDGLKREVSGGYVLTGIKDQVGFQVGRYDVSRPLVIDPVLVYSTLLGGNDNESGMGIAVDGAGNAYVTGFTGSKNFPLTGYPSAPTAFQNTLGGSSDAFVTKFGPTGQFIYSTYLGGSGSDGARGIAVDTSGNAIVTGQTSSVDFPTKNAFQPTLTPGGLFKSSDAGSSWNFLGLPSVSVNAFVINPQTRSTLYAGTSEGVFKSTDSGATWGATSLTSYINSGALVIDPVNPSTLYVGTLTEGVFKSTDGGTTWNTASSGLPQTFGSFNQVRSLTINPVTPSTLYACITSAGVFKSTDGGAAWNATNLITNSAAIVAVDPVTSTTVYAATDQSGVFKSTDGGTTWNATSLTGFISTLAINPVTPSTVYAGTTNGLFVSMDRGATWSATSLTSSPNFLVIDPVSPSTLYIPGPFPSGGLLKSTDGGTTWNAINTGLPQPQPFFNTLAIDSTSPATPAVLYAGTNASAPDVFVTKLNSTGTDLLYSTYLGGSGDDEAGGVAVDASGDAYVTGTTGSRNFPTTPGVFQTNYRQIFVAKLNPNASGSASLIYSTFLGGSFNGGDDRGMAIAVDTSGNASVAGRTHATDFPTTAGAYASTCGTDANCNGGQDDVFVTEINSTGSGLVYSTYLGGSGFEQGEGIAVDAPGNIYVTGRTLSSNFPTLNALQAVPGSGLNAFVAKLNPNASGAASLTYSTYLGGNGDDYGTAIAADQGGNVYVTGSTNSTDFPLANPTQATMDPGNCLHGCSDAFITMLNTAASGAASLVFSTYLGGSAPDFGSGIAVDATGSVYVTGTTEGVFATSSPFPTTPGAFQSSFNGGDDVFVAKISIRGLSLSMAASPNPALLGGRLTYTITVTDIGPDAFTGVTVTDVLPAGTVFVSASSSCTGATSVICNLGTLAGNTNAQITIVVTTAAVGQISNTASVTANEPNPNPSAAMATRVVTVNSNSDLAVTMSASPPFVAVAGVFPDGGNLTYTIVVANNGPDPAAGVKLTDTFPPFVTLVSPATATQGTCRFISLGIFTCDLGSLASGATATITLVGTPSFQALGQITNMVTVSGANVSDPNLANNTAMVVTTARERLSKIAVMKSGPSFVAVGATLAYSIVVTNSGPDAAGGVVMLDTLNTSNFIFNSATPGQGTCSFDGLTVDCDLGILQGGASVPVTLVVTLQPALSPPIMTGNTARAAFTDLLEADANSIQDATSSVTTTVTSAHADLSVIESASPNPVPVGGSLTYTVSVTNNGPDAAPLVTMTDDLSSGVTLTSATPSQGSCSGSPRVECQLGAINAGTTVPVTITVTPNSFGVIRNVANVSANAVDKTGQPTFATTYPLTSCAGTPPRQVSVAFLPVKYAGQATSDLTIAQVATRATYVRDYYLHQSMCAAQFNSTIVTNPASADGWWTLPKTQAAYFPTGNNLSGGDPSPLMSIWSDAFATVAGANAGFLASQVGRAFDAIVVIDTSPVTGPGCATSGSGLGCAVQRSASIMNGAIIDRLVGLLSPTISGSSSVVAATIAGAFAGIVAGTAGAAAGFAAAVFGPFAPALSLFATVLFAPSLPRLAVQATMFEQGSVVISDQDGSDTWTHELGHGVFSLWDYYFYNGPTYSVRGDIQDWDIMSGPSGDVPPAPITSYNRQIPGWLGYIDIPTAQSGSSANFPLTALKDLSLGSSVFRYQTPRDLLGYPKSPTAWYIFELRTPPDDVPIPPERLNADGTPPQSFTDPGDGQTGVVIYDKREINRLFGVAIHNPYCGTAHGVFEQGFVDTLIDLEFGSCLWKVNNLANGTASTRNLPAGADNFTLIPGGASYVDDLNNVTFSLTADNVLNIHGSAMSRTVVRMEVNNTAFGTSSGGASPTSPRLGERYPVDLHVFTSDGRHVGPNYLTGGYDLGIDGARAGGVNTTAQWISLPDSVQASYVIDGSQAAATAAAFGITALTVDATASIFRYDANGTVGKVTDPVHFTLNLSQTTTGQTPIPIGASLGIVQDTAPPVVTPPAAITVLTTEVGGARVSASMPLAAFLAGAKAVDDVDPFPSPMLPQAGGMDVSMNTLFPLGSTTVTFRFQDASGKIGMATSTVTVVPPDTTPPITVATISPAPNPAGWNNTNVSVAFGSTDSELGGTGVKEIHYSIGANPQVVVPGASVSISLTSEGIFSISFYGVDNAGNVEAAHSLTVKIDKTPPTLAFGTPTPAPNPAGWNNTNVSIAFTAADNLSGVASTNPASSPLVLTMEGTAVTGTVTVTDVAGNSATFTSPAFKIDRTPPTLTMPSLAATYAFGATITLTFSAADAFSGIASSLGTLNGSAVTSGAPITLNRPGLNTFTLTASDVASNTATQSTTFNVLYNFIGFLPPIMNDGSRLFKFGSTVPVKFQLTDASGAFVSSAVASLTIQMFSGGTLIGTPIDATPPGGGADTGNLFRFDGTQYIYNLSTQPLSTGTWQIQAHLDDGTVHTVIIGLK